MIIVTGGSGFIGSNLVAGLEEKGYGPIVICDRFGSGDKWRNLSLHALGEFVPQNRLLEYVEKHAKDIEAVFHMGAVSSTTEIDVDLIVESNFKLPLDLWHICTEHKIRFIYASSAATYGDGERGFNDDLDSESLSALKPLNPYGWSKHVFDRRAIALADRGEHPPQWAGFKFFNVYGPNEYHKGEQRSVAHQLFEQVSKSGIAHLFKSYNDDYEDGGQKRDFVWVGDCVDILIWLYENPSVNGLFNAGSGEARTFNDLAGAVFKALDKPENIKYISMPETLKTKYQYFTQATMEKIKAAGYDQPMTSLEDGVAKYINDYLVTDDPYR